jgi:predicted SnoaL-like aldol condensation-catalyzing enzyme
MTRDQIRQTLEVIFDQVFNQGRADLLPGLVSGPYIQHNPLFPNGLDGIMGYIKQAGRIACEVKRIAIDGDLASADGVLPNTDTRSFGAPRVEDSQQVGMRERRHHLGLADKPG